MLGVGVMAMFSGDNAVAGDNLLAGMALALGSAWGYAFYEVLSVKFAFLGQDNLWFVNTVLGLASAVNLLCLWPVLFLVDWLDWENFVVPDVAQARYLFAVASLGALYNVLLMLALVITSPLMVSMASISTVPLSMATSFVLFDVQVDLQSAIGTLRELRSMQCVCNHILPSKRCSKVRL